MREKASGHTFARRRASGSRGSRAMTPAYLGRRTRHAGATHWGGGAGGAKAADADAQTSASESAAGRGPTYYG